MHPDIVVTLSLIAAATLVVLAVIVSIAAAARKSHESRERTQAAEIERDRLAMTLRALGGDGTDDYGCGGRGD